MGIKLLGLSKDPKIKKMQLETFRNAELLRNKNKDLSEIIQSLNIIKVNLNNLFNRGELSKDQTEQAINEVQRIISFLEKLK